MNRSFDGHARVAFAVSFSDCLRRMNRRRSFPKLGAIKRETDGRRTHAGERNRLTGAGRNAGRGTGREGERERSVNGNKISCAYRADRSDKRMEILTTSVARAAREQRESWQNSAARTTRRIIGPSVVRSDRVRDCFDRAITVVDAFQWKKEGKRRKKIGDTKQRGRVNVQRDPVGSRFSGVN